MASSFSNGSRIVRGHMQLFLIGIAVVIVPHASAWLADLAPSQSTTFAATVDHTHTFRTGWSAIRDYKSTSGSSRRSRSRFSMKAVPKFGSQTYWQDLYRSRPTEFSWYSDWTDIEPFISEWVPGDKKSNCNILLPGVGTDPLLLDMYKADYRKLWAFDYASESISFWKDHPDFLQQKELMDDDDLSRDNKDIVDLQTLDARTLTDSYEPNQFDLIIDKGTYDAVYLAGKSTQEKCGNLEKALQQIDLVLKPGGIFWSLSGVCTDDLLKSPVLQSWELRVDGRSLYATEDGYTSNNLDGTLFVWGKPVHCQ